MISIRLANESELDSVKKFIRSIFPNAMVNVTEEDTLLLAERETKMVGFAHIVEDEEKIILQGVGVEKSMRGQGVGTMLIEHALDLLTDTEKPIYLKVKVMNPAIDLYRRHGFFIKRFGTTNVLVKKPNN